MSLNNGEIDLILQELDLPDHSVRHVIQNDFRNLYLQLFRPPAAWWLRVCLEHPRVRLHATSRGPGKKRSHQRFESFLHARVRGGRIVAVEHVNQDRIVRLRILHNGVETDLFIRLWGTRANIIAAEPDGTILDAFFRKPREGIVTGDTFKPPVPADDSLRPVREWSGTASFNEFVDRYYREQEQQEERERLLTTCTRALERRRNRLAARLDEIRRGQQRSADADRFQHQGELILAYLHRAQPGAAWLEVEDYSDDNRTLQIALNPARSPADNAKAYFDKAHRARETTAFLDETAENLENGIRAAEARLNDLGELALQDLRELAEELQGGRDGTGRGKAAEDTVGLEFESRGFRILVGRNARENDYLLRRSVRGNDWWLHSRDFPGGYVFIRTQKNRSIPLEVLLDAGNLAVFYSKARRNGAADLYYTQVKHLRRAKNGPPGLVLPTQEKNLSVELDRERLRSLGIGSDLNLPDR